MAVISKIYNFPVTIRKAVKTAQIVSRSLNRASCSWSWQLEKPINDNFPGSIAMAPVSCLLRIWFLDYGSKLGIEPPRYTCTVMLEKKKP